MKKQFKNAQMADMLCQLKPLLTQRNKIGYVAARNYRIISNCLIEYREMHRQLVEKYGEEFTDENGNKSYRIRANTPEFTSFCNDLAPFNEIEHEIELMTLKYDETIDVLSGEEILNVEWMLED